MDDVPLSTLELAARLYEVEAREGTDAQLPSGIPDCATVRRRLQVRHVDADHRARSRSIILNGYLSRPEPKIQR